MNNECLKCGHAWMNRKPERPRQCPKCWTSGWDKQHRGHRFDFSQIEIEQDKFYIWPEPLEDRPKLIGALNTYMRRTKRKFYIYPETKGMLVRRIS